MLFKTDDIVEPGTRILSSHSESLFPQSWKQSIPYTSSSLSDDYTNVVAWFLFLSLSLPPIEDWIYGLLNNGVKFLYCHMGLQTFLVMVLFIIIINTLPQDFVFLRGIPGPMYHVWPGTWFVADQAIRKKNLALARAVSCGNLKQGGFSSLFILVTSVVSICSICSLRKLSYIFLDLLRKLNFSNRSR